MLQNCLVIVVLVVVLVLVLVVVIVLLVVVIVLPLIVLLVVPLFSCSCRPITVIQGRGPRRPLLLPCNYDVCSRHPSYHSRLSYRPRPCRPVVLLVSSRHSPHCPIVVVFVVVLFLVVVVVLGVTIGCRMIWEVRKRALKGVVS